MAWNHVHHRPSAAVHRRRSPPIPRGRGVQGSPRCGRRGRRWHGRHPVRFGHRCHLRFRGQGHASRASRGGGGRRLPRQPALRRRRPLRGPVFRGIHRWPSHRFLHLPRWTDRLWGAHAAVRPHSRLARWGHHDRIHRRVPQSDSLRWCWRDGGGRSPHLVDDADDHRLRLVRFLLQHVVGWFHPAQNGT